MLKFCPECGSKVTGGKICGNCGADLSNRETSSTASVEADTGSTVDGALDGRMNYVNERQAAEEAARAETERKHLKDERKRIKAELAKFKLDNNGNGTYAIVEVKDKSITSADIPNCVTSIHDWAFSDCTDLTSVTIPSSVTSIGERVFSGCSSLVSITGESSDNDDTATKITAQGGNAKYLIVDNCIIDTESKTLIAGCKTSVIPKDGTVTSIGKYAFYRCRSLSYIEIPNGVTNIGEYTFFRCSSLSEITIPNGVTSIGEYAFFGCSSLTSIEIPNGVTSIGEWAFSDCSSLSEIEIPNSVTSIERSAFYRCSGLSVIEIPNGVTSIERSTFFGCGSLSDIEIPNGVTSIGERAFSDCSSLTTVYYGGTSEDWAKISVHYSNEDLTSAKRYYYSETKPTTDGNYWHYNDEGNIVVWEKED